ncbi:YcxB family protein [Breznakiella homolactica]|uniref:YcxB-like protein domain-containing protein n=1 Tax=Breznakiella homolactica TaxID=2798577 RepID=A0A7T8BB51_9SPIR|nr:YcxB family protein [Breznakiella homolactica]QQO10041.1 hypothetical protein JFL75_03755 [Breznakiella homolactica]
MEYNLKGKISLADYIQFNKTYQKKTGRVFSCVLYSGLVVFLLYTFYQNYNVLIAVLRESPFFIIRTFMPIIIFILFLIVLKTIILPIIYRRHYYANKKLQETQNIRITEECISIAGETYTNNLTKSQIKNILFDKDSIYIFEGINIGHILKKRFLENEDDFTQLINFIKSNYKNNLIYACTSPKKRRGNKT